MIQVLSSKEPGLGPIQIHLAIRCIKPTDTVEDWAKVNRRHHPLDPIDPRTMTLEMDSGKFITQRLARAKTLIEFIKKVDNIVDKAKKFEEFVDGWNDGFPAYRHPLLDDLLGFTGDTCLSSILYDHLIIIDRTGPVCNRCSTRHTNNKVIPKDLSLVKAVHSAFVTEDWDDSIWHHFYRLVTSSARPVEAMCTSVPIQLYWEIYEKVFDPVSLASWESFLLALRRSPKVQLEFFRFIVGRSLSAPAGSRHRSLLLKTLRTVLSDTTLDKRYAEMMEGLLSPELKALCLDCFSNGNNEDARFIFGRL